jgi:hypothetical protein
MYTPFGIPITKYYIEVDLSSPIFPVSPGQPQRIIEINKTTGK